MGLVIRYGMRNLLGLHLHRWKVLPNCWGQTWTICFHLFWNRLVNGFPLLPQNYSRNGLKKFWPARTDKNRLGPARTGMDRLGPVRTTWNRSEPPRTIWFRPGPPGTGQYWLGTSQDRLGPTRTTWDRSRPFGTGQDRLGPASIAWDQSGPVRTAWDREGSPGTGQNRLGLVRTIWDRSRPPKTGQNSQVRPELSIFYSPNFFKPKIETKGKSFEEIQVYFAKLNGVEISDEEMKLADNRADE